MKKRDNYKGGAAVGGVALLALLVGLSFVPAFSIGGVNFKQTDILSDFRPTRGEIVKTGVSSEKSLDTSFLADAPSEFYAIRRQDSIRYIVPNVTDTNLIAIEDFSAGGQMMARFYDALINDAPNRTVRIAVCGDSFIESDILTADIREQLQEAYGGSGVGFVPFSTPLSGYRSTIKHTWSGWTTYNLLKKKSTPARFREEFFISGMTSSAQAGAMSRFVNTSFRDHLSKTNSAQLIFTNKGNSRISVSVNGGEATTYTPSTSSAPDRITLTGDISSITARISNPDGFVGYGVVLEDTIGVSLHNFSVRSSSGLPLFGTSPEVNTAINAMENYDLIILQYGLNVMEARVSDYHYYGEQLRRIIAYLQGSFPQAAILVMSVSDRCSVVNGVPVSMSVADAMETAQRDAARASGVAFWSTRRAMQSKGGMVGFVQQRWAARDYTHIGYNGGREIARVFTDYIAAAVESIENSTPKIFIPSGFGSDAPMASIPALYPMSVIFIPSDEPVGLKPKQEPNNAVQPIDLNPAQLNWKLIIKPNEQEDTTAIEVTPVRTTPPPTSATQTTQPAEKPAGRKNNNKATTISIVPVMDENGEIIRIDTIR